MKERKKKRRYVFIFVSIFALTMGGLYYFLPAESKPWSATETHEYGKAKKQSLTIYKVEKRENKKTPVILYAHGGGWTAGDKSNVAEKPTYFNERGYSFISMNYRLVPDVTYKEQTEDIALALKWVINHADEFNFDTKKISLMGHSAGGHLMMLAMTDPQYLKNVGLSKENIHSIINIEGPLDITSFVTNFSSFKDVYGKDEKQWLNASPNHFIEGNSQPPTLLITHLDEVTDQFIRTSKKAGNTVELFSANTLTHSELTKLIGTTNNKEAAAMTDKLTQFLKMNE